MEAFGHALGTVGVVLLPFTLLALFFMTLAWPVLVWIFFRDISRIRRALERIAEGVPAGRGPGPGGVLGI